MSLQTNAVQSTIDLAYKITAKKNKRNEDSSYSIHIGIFGHKKDLLVKGDTLTQNGNTILFTGLDHIEHCWSSGFIKLYKKDGTKFCTFDDMCMNRTLLIEDIKVRNIPIIENRQMFSKNDNSKCL